MAFTRLAESLEELSELDAEELLLDLLALLADELLALDLLELALLADALDDFSSGSGIGGGSGCGTTST